MAVTAYGSGRINETFRVEAQSGTFVVQRLHPMFSAAVLADVDRVSRHLDGKGLLTARLVRTRDGALGVEHHGRCWRLLTHVPGRSFESGLDAARAASAAALVGRFHDAVRDLDYAFEHQLAGFHDTPLIMARLRDAAGSAAQGPRRRSLHPMVERVLDAFAALEARACDVPLRITHGDLKLSNVRFDPSGCAAIALLDLDTLGRRPLWVDLGDALRSWCNLADEDTPAHAAFSAEIFAAFLDGYLSTARFLTADERRAIPAGLELLTLELAARFLTDAFEERYFTLDSARYPDLYQQNHAKATAQLRFYDDVVAHRATMALQIAKHLT